VIFDSHITFLSTIDLETTARFYENKLGLNLTLDQGLCRIYKVAGESYLGFCQNDKLPPTAGMIITLVADDVDSFCDQLIEKGVVPEKHPVFNPDYNIYHAFFRDPNGYLIEVQRFEDPRWNDR